MKKKILIGLLLLLTSQVLFSQNNAYIVSQNNGFIVKRYYPALTEQDCGPMQQVPSAHSAWWTLSLDLDDDGSTDVYFLRHVYNQTQFSIEVTTPYYSQYGPSTFYGHYSKNISEIGSNQWRSGFNFYGTYSTDEGLGYFAVRKKIGDDYYYGWVFAYYFCNHRSANFQIFSSAMCTVPNRHIFLGQIDINEDFPTLGDEASSDVWYFCQGSYTFLRCSKSLQFASVEVYDTRGVRVNVIEDFNSPGKDWVDISLENHPAGLYIARYRLTDGQEGCVKIIHTR